MLIRLSKESDIQNIVDFLNKTISFGLATTKSVTEEVMSENEVSLMCEIEGEIIGYINGLILKDNMESILLDDHLIESDINFFKQHLTERHYFISKIAVAEEYQVTELEELLNKSLRSVMNSKGCDKGYGYSIWINKEGLIEKLQKEYIYIQHNPNYYRGMMLPCPICDSYCECDTVNVVKHF